ncbi:MAG: TrmH family RNA methyltransferase [bacterium]|nr:TrmH family RNA methyltransferase [bacterium]
MIILSKFWLYNKLMVVILHSVRSLHNVGSIFRTADAAGIEKLYLCGITPTPFDQFGAIRPQVAKVSLGAEKSVAWEKVVSTSRLIDRLKKDGYKILALEQASGSVPYQRFPKPQTLKSKTCLLVGHEVKGLPPSILRKTDRILEIPMRGAMVRQAHHPRRSGRGKESLNVGVAFGIAVFKLIYG